MRWPSSSRRCCTTPRERQVHVVAAEQDVIADRDALEREIAVVFADENQAEVGRAAADVAHEHEIADAELSGASDSPALSIHA